MTRTRKLAELSWAVVQVWPHVSELDPRVYVASDVVSAPVVLPVVHVVPPSQDSWTQNRGERFVELTRPVRLTVIPWTIVPSGLNVPKVTTSLSRVVAVQLVLLPVPELTSLAAVPFGAPIRLARFVSRPLPSPPVPATEEAA